MKNIRITILLIICWSTASGQNVFPTPSGKVGIGTTSPGYLLDIKGSANNEDLLRLSHPTSPSAAGLIIGFGQNKDLADNSAIDFKVEYSNTDYFVFGINRLNRDFFYMGDGNFGIGTNAPENALHLSNLSNDGINLNSEFRLRTSSVSNSFVLEHIADDGNLIIRSIEQGDNGGDLILNDLGGNVGVGTENPQTILDIKAASNNQNLFRLSHPNSPTAAGFIVGFGQNKDLADNGSIDFKVEYSSNEYDVLGINRLNRDFYYIGDGNFGIGTNDPKSKLAVEGQIRATEVKVLSNISVPDYVFEPSYDLRTLKETKAYISENKHLPEIPSAADIAENGIDLGDMNMRLLKKVEELTLYQIELLEKVEELQNKMEKLENK